MSETLLNATELDVANYIIKRAHELHKNVENLKLNAIMAFLEGYSQAKYGKSMCQYDQYFKYGTMYTVILPTVYEVFRDYGASPISDYYQNIELKSTFKVDTPMLHFENTDSNIDFAREIDYALCYQLLVPDIFMPSLKKIDLKSSTSVISKMPNITAAILKAIFIKFHATVEKTGKYLMKQYADPVNNGFPTEIVTADGGHDLIVKVNQLAGDKKPMREMLIKIVKQAYKLGKENHSYRFGEDDEDSFQAIFYSKDGRRAVRFSVSYSHAILLERKF